jgi:hypothetical protein
MNSETEDHGVLVVTDLSTDALIAELQRRGWQKWDDYPLRLDGVGDGPGPEVVLVCPEYEG